MTNPHILLLAACLASLTACSENGLKTDSRDIRFSAKMVTKDATKALLESADILVQPTQVKIYGLATTGAIQGYNTATGEPGSTYLNAGQSISVQSDGKTWAYNNGGEAYQWNNSADYRFFGWLEKDKNGDTAATFFGSAPALSDSTVSIPAKQMGISESNFDFSYTDVVVRTSAAADYSNVELPLNHLFASFSLSARNYTDSPITITSVKITGLRDQKGATITFGKNASSVVYGTGSTSGATELLTGDVTLAKAGDADFGDIKQNIAFGSSSTKKYFLVWPQLPAEMAPTNTYTAGTTWTPASGDAYLTVTYQSEGAAGVTASIPLPYDTDIKDADGVAQPSLNGWAAGTRHMMELSFSEKQIKLGVLAANWDEKDPVIDYEGAVSIPKNGTLSLADGFESYCNQSTSDPGTYYFRPGYPIVLKFRIDQPANSAWLITKNGDFDVFKVINFDTDDEAGSVASAVTAEGVVDSNITYIAIMLDPEATLQKSEYKISLSFSVRLGNGEMKKIDDEIYGASSPRTFIYQNQ